MKVYLQLKTIFISVEFLENSYKRLNLNLIVWNIVNEALGMKCHSELFGDIPSCFQMLLLTCRICCLHRSQSYVCFKFTKQCRKNYSTHNINNY